MNTAMFLLRCTQLGLSMTDLEHLSIGMVLDMAVESGNDRCEYPYKATQGDIDKFVAG